MKLYMIILSLILGTSVQTYAMQKQTKDQATQKTSVKEDTPLLLMPAIAPHVTQKTIFDATEYCLKKETDSSQYEYAACIISSNNSFKEKSLTKDYATIEEILVQKLSRGDVCVVVRLSDKFCKVVTSKKDATDLKKSFEQQPSCIPFILSLALLDKSKTSGNFTLEPKDVEAFNALPSHMQANLKSYYPWLSQAVNSSSNSWSTWALWAAIPVAVVASYLVYTWFFKKAPAVAK